MERSAHLQRSCLEQLEAIKTEFYAFVTMFQPEDGRGASSSSSSSTIGGARPTVRSPTSSSVGQHMMSSLHDDMADIQRRLHALSSSQRGL